MPNIGFLNRNMSVFLEKFKVTRNSAECLLFKISTYSSIMSCLSMPIHSKLCNPFKTNIRLFKNWINRKVYVLVKIEKPKIAFLTSHFNLPSTRFRVIQYLDDFKNLGLNVCVKVVPRSSIKKVKLFNSLKNYDIVFLQKKLISIWLSWYLRKMADILIYDFDDAVLYRDSNYQRHTSSKRFKRFKFTIRIADAVIAGNNYLMNLASDYNEKIYTVPTGIDTRCYLPTSNALKTKQVVIGWIGSKSNLIYLKELIAPINTLYAAGKNIKLKIVCDDFINGFECQVEKIQWSESDEIDQIQSFDIGVFPIQEDPWTKGKCAFKLLQYMSCGLPSVSSLNVVTADIINDGINGFLASSSSEWIEKLNILIDNLDQRKTMGEQARISLIGRYDTKTLALKYHSIFMNLLENKDRIHFDTTTSS